MKTFTLAPTQILCFNKFNYFKCFLKPLITFSFSTAHVQVTHYVKLGSLIRDIDVFFRKDLKEELAVIKVYLGVNFS